MRVKKNNHHRADIISWNTIYQKYKKPKTLISTSCCFQWMCLKFKFSNPSSIVVCCKYRIIKKKKLSYAGKKHKVEWVNKDLHILRLNFCLISETIMYAQKATNYNSALPKKRETRYNIVLHKSLWLFPSPYNNGLLS